MKYILWVLLAVFGLLLLVSALLYLPPVQNLVKNQAVRIASESTGMQLSVDRLRLTFPMTLRLDNAVAVTAEGDTLVDNGKLGVSVALWPLLRGNIVARRLWLENTSVHFRDTTSGIDLRARVENIAVRRVRLRMKDRGVRVRSVELAGADVSMMLGEPSGPPEQTPADTLPWKFDIRSVDLDSVNFTMRSVPMAAIVEALLMKGAIADCMVDLGTQSVEVGSLSLDRGRYAYLTDTLAVRKPVEADTVEADTTAAPPSLPWTVRTGKIELRDNALDFGVMNGSPGPGFDPDHISLSAINITIDSAYNRGSDIAATIGALALAERSGVVIEDGHGYVSMDSTGIKVDDLRLQTRESDISLSAQAGGGIVRMEPSARVNVQASAKLLSDELFRLYPADSSLRRALRGLYLTLGADVSGTLGRLDLRRISAQLQGHVDMEVSGSVSSVTDPERLAGDVKINGNFRDMEFVRGMIPDTALRRRIGFPARMSIHGVAAALEGRYSPALRLEADSGYVDVKGYVDLPRKVYDAGVDVVDFPLHAFLPHDSLGVASLTLKAAGTGFDPTADGATADASLKVERVDYIFHAYHNITLQASLRDHEVKGRIESTDDAVALDFDIGGGLYPNIYLAQLEGRIRTLDMQRMNFSAEPFAASGKITLDAAAYPDTAYMANMVIDSVSILHGGHTHRVGNTTIDAVLDSRSMNASLRSGDLRFDLISEIGIDSVAPYLKRLSAEAQRQLEARSLDMAQLQSAMPSFRLDVAARRANPLGDYMRTQGYDFNTLEARARTLDGRPFSASVVVQGLRTSGLMLDTLNVWMRGREQKLQYALRLRNRPGNLDGMALIRVMGEVAGHGATANFYQRDRSDSVGFNFGLRAELLDSAVRVSMTPENPVFGYRKWTLNADNYLTYNFDQTLAADLRLDGQGSHVYIETLAGMAPGSLAMPPGSVRLDVAGIDIGRTLGMFPAMPPVAGMLSANAAVGFDAGKPVVDGNVNVGKLAYNNIAVGDIAAALQLWPDAESGNNIKASVGIDGKDVLKAEGTMAEGSGDGDSGPVFFTGELTALPLKAVNAFIPDDAARLEGTLSGNLRLRGSGVSDMSVNGGLSFDKASVFVTMIGTKYGISDGRIRVRNNILTLDNFSITDSGGQPLSLDGRIDMRDLASPVVNLDLFAVNFRVIDSRRSGGSQVYGRATLDVDISANGPADALSVKGNVGILSDTDVTYVMRDSPLAAESRKQDLVTFVSFADTTAMAMADSTLAVRNSGIDIVVGVDIANGVRATMNLSENGNNRVELIGEGSLSYTQNKQGDSRLTGRYTLSGGTVVYSPPVISQKEFDVTDGSYVEWTGEMMNPAFNIEAVESLRTTVEFEGDGASRPVDFEIIIRIGNNLENMAIAFDLAAPGDMTINNQLAAMAPEERSQQAMGLLVYNTYSGAGTKATVDANNPLNAFIAKELNQWARNNLNSVDVSFGINTVDDAAGNQHTDYSYKVSKSLFDDRVKVSIGGSVSSGTSAGDNMKENFVDDISLEYRLTKRDNMFLKVYRYNTQESILEGEVTETGAGFLVRKKMDRIRELFKFRPPPERRQQRQFQRDFRQRTRQLENEAIADSMRSIYGEDSTGRFRRYRRRPGADSLSTDSSRIDSSRTESAALDSTVGYRRSFRRQVGDSVRAANDTVRPGTTRPAQPIEKREE